MIATKAMATKFCKRIAQALLGLSLAGCAIPFGIPQGTPDHPIITSGYFNLPDGASLPYRRPHHLVASLINKYFALIVYVVLVFALLDGGEIPVEGEI